MQTSYVSFPIIAAAQIMTPRKQWLAVRPGDDPGEVIDEATRQRYDLIPVLNSEDQVIHLLQAPDYSEKKFSLDWCSTHDASLETLLTYFVETDHPACFLLSGREVIGLVTPADFNKAVARMAIYVHLAELELLLAQFLRSSGFASNETILKNLSPNRREDLKKLLNNRREQNAEVDLLEELTLSELLNLVVKEEQLHSQLGFNSRRQAKNAVSGLVDLRNRVDHPVRHIHHGMDVRTLNNRLQQVESLVEKIQDRLGYGD